MFTFIVKIWLKFNFSFCTRSNLRLEKTVALMRPWTHGLGLGQLAGLGPQALGLNWVQALALRFWP